jgi:hypothetical protein
MLFKGSTTILLGPLGSVVRELGAREYDASVCLSFWVEGGWGGVAVKE